MKTRKKFLSCSLAVRFIAALTLVLLCIGKGSTCSAAIHVNSSIFFTTPNAFVDSYDSRDDNKSTNGRYDPLKAGSNAEITTKFGPLNLNNAIVHGYVDSQLDFPFPQVSLPFDSGIEPAFTNIITVSGTNYTTVVRSVTNSLDLPPNTSPDEIVFVTTNWVSTSTTNYPGEQPGMTTNSSTVITATNSTVTVYSNLVCGTTVYTAASLPENVCSYDLVPKTQVYHYILIVGTNLTYVTNVSYTFTTNYTYTYLQPVYDYHCSLETLIYQSNPYGRVLSGDYFCPNGLSGECIITGPSRVVLPGNLQMTSADRITINEGASLTLYVGGTNCSLLTGSFTNQSGHPKNLIFYCTGNVTQLSLSANTSSNFIGAIVASGAHVIISSPHSTLNFQGLLLAESLLANGTLNFHYDEALEVLYNPPRPFFPVKLSDGSFQFMVGGASGNPFVLQSSTNFVDWISIATNVPNFYFTETNSAESQKFFRVVRPQD